MVPIIEVSGNDLKAFDQLGIDYVRRRDLENENLDNFIYVPSINLYVAKERTLHEENWFECHKKLQNQGSRMLTVPEFVEFLKYSKENHQDIYNDITEERSPWRAEWLDADFKVKDKKLYLNYNHILDLNESLIPKNSEFLDKNTLMKDKIPGISLEDWLENPTKQGFPNKEVKSGDLWYWNPRSDDNSVVRFDACSDRADLDCLENPSDWDSYLGVRAAKQRE